MNYYLYKITNLVNGKLYIGVTNNPDKRKRQHLYEDKNNKNPLIKAAIRKYGVESLVFEVVCIGSQEYIYDLERKAVEAYGSRYHGYNLIPGGRGGLGNKVKKRSDDYECYVSGFWFPNKRTACEALNITNTNVFYNRKKKGILGDVKSKVKGSVYSYPSYYKGFWFPNVEVAALIFNKTETAIHQAIKRGRIEEYSGTITQHPIKVPVVNGVVYKNFQDASQKLLIPYNTLRQYFYNNKEGFYYAYTTI